MLFKKVHTYQVIYEYNYNFMRLLSSSYIVMGTNSALIIGALMEHKSKSTLTETVETATSFYQSAIH